MGRLGQPDDVAWAGGSTCAGDEALRFVTGQGALAETAAGTCRSSGRSRLWARPAPIVYDPPAGSLARRFEP